MPRTTEDKVFRRIVKQLKNEPKFNRVSVDWDASDFLWIRVLSPRTKGSVGEALIHRWLMQSGFSVKKSTKRDIAEWLTKKRIPCDNPKSTDADLIVNGVPVEVKLSTLWDGGCFVFQQLRNQNYEYAFFLGLEPKFVRCWVLSKKTILKRWDNNSQKDINTLDDIVSQHASGSDTAWLRFYANNPPKWLNRYGGSLDKALSIIHATFNQHKAPRTWETSARREDTP